MKHAVLGIVLALVPFAVLANDTKGLIVEKSFLQSVHDCVEYLKVPKQRLVQYLAYEFPPDEETKCLIHCVGTDLRWWNNTSEVQVPAIINFFQPVQGDRQYEKRTGECLERNVHSVTQPNNLCCQAYETFQCYFREFGNLVTCPQYVPATKLQATQAALDCLNMLRVPAELLKRYRRGDLPDVPETRCLYHCIDLRTGLYTPENGVQLSRFYVRDMSVNDMRYLSKETKACRDRVRQSGCDSCTEVYNTHRQCLAGIGEAGYTSGLITEAAAIALMNLGVTYVQKLPEPVLLPEVGYSYASYQPVATSTSKTFVAPKLTYAPTLPPTKVATVPITLPTPVYTPRKPFNAYGSVPKTVQLPNHFPTPRAPLGGHRSAPFVKHVEHSASGRPQLVYYPLPSVQEPSPCPVASAVVNKPAFSTFGSRLNPERSYPSFRNSRLEHHSGRVQHTGR